MIYISMWPSKTTKICVIFITTSLRMQVGSGDSGSHRLQSCVAKLQRCCHQTCQCQSFITLCFGFRRQESSCPRVWCEWGRTRICDVGPYWADLLWGWCIKPVWTQSYPLQTAEYCVRWSSVHHSKPTCSITSINTYQVFHWQRSCRTHGQNRKTSKCRRCKKLPILLYRGWCVDRLHYKDLTMRPSNVWGKVSDHFPSMRSAKHCM